MLIITNFIGISSHTIQVIDYMGNLMWVKTNKYWIINLSYN